MKINLQNTNEFDNFFKKKYAKDTIEPSLELWENIDKKIKFKSISTNNRNILKLKIAVATLTVALIGIITFFGIAFQNTKIQKTQIENFNENTHTLNKEALNSLPLKNKDTLTVISDVVSDNMQETKQNKDIKINTQKDSCPKNNVIVDYRDSFVDTQFIVENKKPEIKNISNIQTQNSKIQKTQIDNFNENIQSLNKEALNSLPLKNKDTLIVISDVVSDNMQETKPNKDIKINTQKDSYPKNNVIVDYRDSFVDTQFIVENKKPEIKNISNIPTHNINDVLGNDTLVNTQFIFPDNNIENNEKTNNNETSVNGTQNNEVNNDNTPNERNKRKEEGNKFSVELSITPQYSYRTLYNNAGYYDPDLGKAYFNSREKPNMSFSAGFQFIYTLNERWRIDVGAAYSQYSQKMRISSFDLKTDNQNGYYIYTSIGINDLTINSSEPVSNVDFLKSHIIYSFINIPLTAEYKLTDKFFITGGINYNFLFAKNINWQAEDYKGDFSITTNNITGLKTSNFSFMLGAGYIKSIGQNISLIINPRFTSFMTSITNEMPVKTYPYSFGLKLGLRYKF